MSVPCLISIQVGLPQRLGVEGAADPAAQPWYTGLYKEPIAGPVWLGRTNLAGDGQADRAHHGGPDKAVLAYGAGHYPAWRTELDRPDFPFGAFGENFDVDRLTEETVYIGDSYAIGDARVQVSQPRSPCWKLARRWGVPDLTARVQRTGRTGWYLRVLVEGEVRPGLPVVLVDRPFPQWTVARAGEVIRQKRNDPAAATELAACPLLAASVREALLAR